MGDSSEVSKKRISRVWCNPVAHIVWDDRAQFKSDIFDKNKT